MAKSSYLGAIASRASADAPSLAPPRRAAPAWSAERGPVASMEVETRRPARARVLAQPPEAQGSPRAPAPLESTSTDVAAFVIPGPSPVTAGDPIAAATRPVPAFSWPAPERRGDSLEGEPRDPSASPPEPPGPLTRQPPRPPARPEARAPASVDPMAAVGAALHTAMQWVAEPTPQTTTPRPSPASTAVRSPRSDVPPDERAESPGASPMEHRARVDALPRLPSELFPGNARPKAAEPRSIHIGAIEVHVKPPPPPASPPRREARHAASGTTNTTPTPLSRGFASTLGLRQG